MWLKSVFDQDSCRMWFFCTLSQHLIKLIFGISLRNTVFYSVFTVLWHTSETISHSLHKYVTILISCCFDHTKIIACFQLLEYEFLMLFFIFHDSKVDISGFWTQTTSSWDSFALFSDILQIKLLINRKSANISRSIDNEITVSCSANGTVTKCLLYYHFQNKM